jgi:nucleoside-diphosphate-sugar epimerase
MKKYLVTGGTGFLGRSIVERLSKNGDYVVILDNESRGSIKNLNIKNKNIKFIKGDIREKKVVEKACEGIDTILHLAYINGTENFYKKPEVVLEVAVKGMMNLLDGAIKEKVQEFFLASSSEVYNEPKLIPTPESVSLVVPDPLNPRYSYSGGKIISELLAIHNSKHFKRTVIFRPHNVYGPAMGFEHVIPQFIMRLKEIKDKQNLDFSIQGDGKQTRSFIFINDFTSALMFLFNKAQNLETYNIGTTDEISIKKLALMIAKKMDINVNVIAGPLTNGSPQRRCPDVTKLSKLGFLPKISLEQGLDRTIEWYIKQ